jgi:hypothetical protein
MDELTLVAGLRDDVPGIDLAGPESRLAAEVAAASDVAGGMGRTRGLRKASETGAGAARRKRGHQRRLVTVTAVTAAAAAALVAVVAVQNQAAHRSPTATGSPGPSAAPAPGPAATAAQLVAYATRVAAGAPVFDPKPHDWIYSETVAATSAGPAGGFLFGPVNGRRVDKSWTRVDGLQRARIEHGKLVVWPSKAYEGELGGWPNSSYAYLDSLPASPGKLKAVIEAGLKAENYVIGSGNIGIFNSIENLMSSVALSPKLSAGLYGVLAADPAVHFDPGVADFAGQTGVAFYTYQEGYIKSEIVINPRTYAYMGERDVAYRSHSSLENSGDASDGTIHIRMGQILDEEATLHFGIVRHPGQVP